MTKSILSTALFVAVALIALTFIFPNVFQRTEIAGSYRSGVVAYDYARGRTPFVHRAVGMGTAKSFSISFRFRATATRKYDDLFQTAPGNAGVRMELSKPSGNLLALIVGAEGDPGYVPYVVARGVKAGSWYTFDLRIDQAGDVSARLNGAPVVNETNPGLAYELSNIEIGAGLNGARPFVGEIDNASFSYAFYRVNEGNTTMWLVRILIAVVAIGLALGLVIRRSASPAPEEETTSGIDTPVTH